MIRTETKLDVDICFNKQIYSDKNFLCRLFELSF